MRKIVKDFLMLTFVVISFFPLMFIVNNPVKHEVNFVFKRHEQYFEQVFHTYYVDVGYYDIGNKGYDNYTDYPSYTINEETGEWSDGGNYGVNGDYYFYKVNESGEKTRIGVIIAVKYGHKMIYHLG